ncbi:MAG: hypothetical protein N2A42_09215 [Luteolibacter sp.]|jgi:hypothetical protein|tara:strand:+ start:393 stop:572 length:180 start_codon:yes stop_codon:yes gene_type:complete
MVATPSQTRSNHGFEASVEKPILFNVEEDFGERIDRPKEYPERVKRMLELLQSKIAATR